MSTLTVLIAEDGAADRLLLRRLLTHLGHRVLEAEDGVQAVEIFQAERPDMVLMDALMPRMDGFEATRRIKQYAGDELVPIIFLTSLHDAEALSHCLAAGGDDFLTKPYNRIILAAKIDAFARMRSMHSTLQHQRDEIAGHNHRLLTEQEIAKRVYDKVAHAGCLRELPNIRYNMSPLSVFNGDVALAGIAPSGNLMVLLGDFTGHGLAAAIGAMPLAQTFYTMVNNGFELREVVAELNAKMRASLPVGVFCCAALMELDLRRGCLRFWNGGLPEGLLYRCKEGRAENLPSRHLPLGIVEDARFDRTVETVSIAVGDQIMWWTDGILEARNAAGEMFGEQRLREVVSAGPSAHAYDRVVRAVRDFIVRQAPADDLSMLAVTVPRGDCFVLPAVHGESPEQGRPVNWQSCLQLNAESLRDTNPVPRLLSQLSEVAQLRALRGTLSTVLAELYSNALEHGVLGLDSRLKSNPVGFGEYYRERQQRLQNLKQGFVRFDLHCRGDNNGGVVTIAVSDSGDGFAHLLDSRAGGYSGRGLRLLKELCQRVEHSEGGRTVTVELAWQRHGALASDTDR